MGWPKGKCQVETKLRIDLNSSYASIHETLRLFRVLEGHSAVSSGLMLFALLGLTSWCALLCRRWHKENRQCIQHYSFLCSGAHICAMPLASCCPQSSMQVSGKYLGET